MVESHLIACRIPTLDCIILFEMCELWNMTIACALRWGVALVGSLLYWAQLTLHGIPLSGAGSKPVDDAHSRPQS